MTWCRYLGPQVGGGLLYETTRPVYLVTLTVPRGAIFDVSIPWLLRWWLDPHDPRFLRAAAAHDHAIRLGHGRVRAATPFAEALRRDGVGRWLRLAMVLGVVVWKWK